MPPSLRNELTELRSRTAGAGGHHLYQQLEQIFRQAIASGSLKPGTVLPGETELAEASGVSRVTVRSALDRLVTTGLLTRKKGRRTEVAQRPIETDVTVLQSFTEEMRIRGMESQTTFSQLQRVRGSREVTDGLELPPRSEVLQLRRVRSVERVPLVLFETHLRLWTGLDQQSPFNGSLYGYLRSRHGIAVASAQDTLEAVGAPAPVARDLQIRRGTPLLRLMRRTLAADGRVIEVTFGYYRADRFRYRVQSFCPPEKRG
jgi:GntR family transcriptional regulator